METKKTIKKIRWKIKGSIKDFGGWYYLLKETKTHYIIKFPIAPLYLKKEEVESEIKGDKK